jgi:hypothetical protein
VSIQQFQLRYDMAADRILLQLRTESAELYRLWLTRRLFLSLWPHYQAMTAQVAAPPMSAGAVVSQQARQMLAEVARDKPLPNANFGTPFNAEGAKLPLGDEPMLPTEVNLQTSVQSLTLRWRDQAGRRLSMELSEEMALGLMRLMDKALAESAWDKPVMSSVAPPEAPGSALLN